MPNMVQRHILDLKQKKNCSQHFLGYAVHSYEDAQYLGMQGIQMPPASANKSYHLFKPFPHGHFQKESPT